MSYELDELNERVTDIEHCIGDFQAIFESLKAALDGRTGPLCPPYCAHTIEEDSEDPLPLDARVVDLRKCIGDIESVFEALALSLGRGTGPLCPPYCAHSIDEGESQS